MNGEKKTHRKSTEYLSIPNRKTLRESVRSDTHMFSHAHAHARPTWGERVVAALSQSRAYPPLVLLAATAAVVLAATAGRAFSFSSRTAGISIVPSPCLTDSWAAFVSFALPVWAAAWVLPFFISLPVDNRYYTD